MVKGCKPLLPHQLLCAAWSGMRAGADRECLFRPPCAPSGCCPSCCCPSCCWHQARSTGTSAAAPPNSRGTISGPRAFVCVCGGGGRMGGWIGRGRVRMIAEVMQSSCSSVHSRGSGPARTPLRWPSALQRHTQTESSCGSPCGSDRSSSARCMCVSCQPRRLLQHTPRLFLPPAHTHSSLGGRLQLLRLWRRLTGR